MSELAGDTAAGLRTCARCGTRVDVATALRDERGEMVCPACPAEVVRALELAPGLLPLLARVRELRAPGARCAVAQAKLDAVEKTLGSVLPDAVVAAAIASGVPLDRFVDLTAMRAEFAAVQEIERRPSDLLVVLDTWGDWPTFSAGLRPTRSRAEPALLVWDWKSWSALPGYPIRTVEDWIRRRLGEDSDEAPLDLETPPSATALASFRPVIEGALPIVAAPERRVRHPKLGVGRVLREADGKLEIDFGAGGVRTILARFVTPEP